MNVHKLARQAQALHQQRHGVPPEALAYAPGRIEVLGNHTDYNEGFVLSAAIDAGTCVAVSRADGNRGTVYSAARDSEEALDVAHLAPGAAPSWANYIRGMLHGLALRADIRQSCHATVASDIPMGAGLSSSAALEMATGLALARLYEIDVPKLDLAKMGQRAEHEFAGVRCGLLDQMTSLFAEAHALVWSDFRNLSTQPVPLPPGLAFVMANTAVQHALAESGYNERRERCEAATAFFAQALGPHIRALRDVSLDDWQRLAPEMDPVTARRATHIIGENQRVLEGIERLRRNDAAGFGALLYASHTSSRTNFENSCPELDLLVDEAQRTPGVFGARLSGGGFGGSVAVLVREEEAETVSEQLTSVYDKQFGSRPSARLVRPSAGARLL